MTANRVVLRHDVLERARHVGREDHVDDVLAARLRSRRDRVDDRDRAFEWNLDALREEPGLLPQLAIERAQRGSRPPAPRRPAAAGLPARFSCREEQDAPRQRRIADTRIRGSATAQLDDDPNRATPRSLPASSSASTSCTDATGAIDELRDAHAGSTT